MKNSCLTFRLIFRIPFSLLLQTPNSSRQPCRQPLPLDLPPPPPPPPPSTLSSSSSPCCRHYDHLFLVHHPVDASISPPGLTIQYDNTLLNTLNTSSSIPIHQPAPPHLASPPQPPHPSSSLPTVLITHLPTHFPIARASSRMHYLFPTVLLRLQPCIVISRYRSF